MKVGFNCLSLQTGHKYRGIGFYTKNLLESLQKNKDLEVIEFNKDSEIAKVDLIHYPYFDLFQNTLPFQKHFPTVVTIHDVTPLKFPRNYPSGIRGSFNNLLQKVSLKTVKAVITDSEASKNDIPKYLGVNPAKIYVVHLAGGTFYRKIKDLKILGKVKDKYRLPEKFAIYIGSVNWNKNLLNLTQACLEAGLDLVLVGKDFENRDNLGHPERQSYRQFLKKYKENPQIHILGYIIDEDLVGIVNLANVLLLPSYYEGFGLPILDAQNCGTPVITSNISSMPEIAGKGALLVDPNSSDSISEGISQIIKNPEIRSNLIKLGFENVKRFSWEKCARETIEVYKYAISSSKIINR